jgi:hypothetical protein
MAFVAGFHHDLFVSYAHLDDVPLQHQEEGWIDAFVRMLGTEVRQRVGDRGFTVWMDPQVAPNRPLTPQILETARHSAMLLIVMSPGYLNSTWCASERDSFLSSLRDRVTQGSVFVVHQREVSRESIPPELRDLVGYSFFCREREAGPDRPLALADGQKFMSKLYELSVGIQTQAQRLKTPGLAAAPAGPFVFVARATEDLEDREDELRGYLSQAGLAVLPQKWYSQTDRALFEAAMKADLARSSVFVQLLSGSRGREMPFDATLRLAQLQNDIAAASGVPMLAWRDRSLDLTTVRPAHLPLVERAQASGIEDFKRTVVELARKKPPSAVFPRRNIMVFVNADAPDRAMAEQVAMVLGESNIDCYTPLSEGPPDVIRKDLESALKSCDAMMLLYGETGANWVRRQLMEGRKILSQREQPPAALAVVHGPPPEPPKPALGAVIPNLTYLDCRTGLNRAVLRDFAAALFR